VVQCQPFESQALIFPVLIFNGQDKIEISDAQALKDYDTWFIIYSLKHKPFI